MATYNLGSVQGDIEIEYDGKGVATARADVKAAAAEIAKQKLVLSIDADMKVLENKLTTARADLARLEAMDPEVRVQADVDQAMANVARIELQLAALQDKKVRIVFEGDEVVEGLTRINDANYRAGESTRSFRKDLGDLGNDLRNTREAVTSFGTAMGAVMTPTLFAGGIAGAAAFVAAVGPVINIIGLVPGAVLAAAASMGTLKVATKGVGDAMKAVGEGDAKKLAEAMAKLSPEAKEFVSAYAGIKPTFDKMQLQVQDSLFRGLGTTLTQLSNTFLPGVANGFNNIAEAMNGTAIKSANALMKPEVVSGLNNVLDFTARAFAGLDDSIGVFLASFIKLGETGASYLPLFTSNLNAGADAFARWTDEAIASGRFAAGLENGMAVLSTLTTIVINLGKTFANVFSAIRGETGTLLTNIAGMTQAMAQWTASAEGQDKIKEIFNALAQITQALLTILPVLGSVLATIATVFASLPEPVQTVVASMLAWGGILGIVISKLSPLIAIITNIGPAIKLAVSAFKTMSEIIKIVQIAFIALRAVMLANPFIAIAAAVVAIAILIITNWDTIKAALAAAWEWIKSTAETVWNAITSFFSGIWNGIVSVWNSVWSTITGFFTGVWNAIKTAATTIWNGIVSFFTTVWQVATAPFIAIWNGIVTFLQGVWNVISTIFRYAAAIILAIFFSIWNPLSELVVTVWNAIVSFLTAVWNGIVAQAIALWTVLVDFFTTIWTAISDLAMTVWNAIVDFFTTIWDAVSSAFQTAWNAIVDFLTPIWEAISSTAETIWNAITDAISTAVDAVWNVIQSVWNTIWGFLQPIWNTISSVASSVFNAISSVISSVWNTISNITTTVWNAISGFFSSVWSSISSAVSNGANQVWTFLTGLWDKIKGVAGEAINWLVDAGKNIVTGLWNGIVSMGQWLWSQIMGWIKSVVPGPILSFLGIASPSRWMRDEVGRMIPQGIMVGMEADEKGLINQAKKMAESVAQAATGGPNVSTLAAAAAGNNTAASSLPAVAGLSGPSSGSSVVNLGGVTLQITGNLDPTNEVAWRNAMSNIQDGLLDLEKSYS